MNDLRLHLLGAPLVERAAEAVTFGRRKTLALLAYLAVTQQVQRRDALAVLLWPDLDRSRGLASLRRCLVSLSKIFGAHLVADRSTLELKPTPGLWVDVWEYTAAERDCLSESEDPRTIPIDQLARLEAAADLYRGDFLAGFSLPDGEEFDDWQFTQTERFRRLQSKIIRAITHAHEVAGRFETALEWGERLLLLDRLDEGSHRLLIRLHLEAGERSEALRQYERCVEILRAELDIEPEPATTALVEEIRTHSGTSQASLPIAGSEMALPEAHNPILGREIELGEIADRLSGNDCRLVSLIGPGGIGKTRLALETAHTLSKRFADGVCFVELAAATSETTLATITDQLGLSLDPKGNAETQLFSHLREKRMLLVLDNFEHVADQSGLVAQLLSHTRGLKILVTSRERLNLRGESVFEVHGLAVPRAATREPDLTQYGAVLLFLDSARRVQPDFEFDEESREAVVEICRRLEGMPLGLELAAAWLRLIPCSEVAAEIRRNVDFLSTDWHDVPSRHRSLRAVFESSLQLLEPDQRELLSVLSLFRGGFSRQAAEKIAGASLVQLAGLLDKSLLRRGRDGRYQIHELLRQFAEEPLQAEPEKLNEAKLRHAHYYLDLLVQSARHFAGPRLKETLTQLHREVDNLRLAWTTAIEANLLDLIDAALEPYHQYHQLANRFVEGERRMGAAVETVSPDDHPLLWARAATRQGRFCNRLGQYKKAHRLLEDSLQILVKLDAAKEIAFTQIALSVVFFHFGDFPQAQSLAAAGVKLWRELGDTHGLANALVQYGRTVGLSGDIEEAMSALHEAYELFDGFQDVYGVARCLNNLANLTYLSGNQNEAIRLFELSKKSFEDLGDQRGSAFTLANLAVVMEDLGHHAEAKAMSQQALALFRAIGYQEADSRTRGPAIPLENCGRACLGLGEYDEARNCFLAALETAVRIQQTPLILASLLGLARWMIHAGQTDKAWEIVELASDHPRLTVEGSRQLADLRRRLEELPNAKRPPKSRQPASIRLRLLIDELLGDTDPLLPDVENSMGVRGS